MKEDPLGKLLAVSQNLLGYGQAAQDLTNYTRSLIDSGELSDETVKVLYRVSAYMLARSSAKIKESLAK